VAKSPSPPLAPLYSGQVEGFKYTLLRAVSRGTAHGGRKLHLVRECTAGIQVQKIYFRNFDGSESGASLSTICVLHWQHLTS
jgi:hypothetical protein